VGTDLRHASLDVAASSRRSGGSSVGWRKRIPLEATRGSRRAKERGLSRRSTIARILKAHGVPPVPKRPTSWQTFVRAHMGRDRQRRVLHEGSWTWRGLVTYYTLFVIDLVSCRVQIVGSTPHPNELFMRQVGRTLTAAEVRLLRDNCMLICDRLRKWNGEVRRLLREAGLRVVQTPLEAPNANAYGGTLRAIDQTGMPRSDHSDRRSHFLRAVAEFVAHYHDERNHQGLDSALMDDNTHRQTSKRIRRRPRLGLLNYCERAARGARPKRGTLRGPLSARGADVRKFGSGQYAVEG
jgi:hypothetical protein